MDISKRTRILLIAISGFLLSNKLHQICLMFFKAPSTAASIGIIGSLDGPTTVLVKAGLLPEMIFSFLCLFLEIFLYLYVLIKSVKSISR